jgi:D-alanyl-D-alanine dipeptidase
MRKIVSLAQLSSWLLGFTFVIYSCQPAREQVAEVPVKPSPVSPTVADTLNQLSKPEPAPDILSEQVSEAEQALIDAGLVDVQTLDSTIRVELKYSTTDNFVGVDVYGDLSKAYLQKEPARKLVKAQRYLRETHPGYRLLIYDAARSRRVQQILWDTLQKPAKLKPLYVADPKVGSIHNYGAAVDLTVTDPTGKPLDMGTGYDFFGELAYPSKEEVLLQQGKLTQEQLDNRMILREAMRRAGFTPIESEWWHFNALSLVRCRQQYGIIE